MGNSEGLHVHAELRVDDEVFWLHDIHETAAWEGGIMLKLPQDASPVGSKFTIVIESEDVIGMDEFRVQVHRA